MFFILFFYIKKKLEKYIMFSSVKSFQTIFKEGAFVGFFLIIIVYAVGFIMKFFGYPMNLKYEYEDLCMSWNSHKFMEVNLFLSGMLFHIICEYTGLNEWYVREYIKFLPN